MRTSIELFAGAGGLALGLEESGFHHLALIERDATAAATLKLNRPNWNVLNEDVAAVAERDLEAEFQIARYELDLLSGGAPCQAFSYSGKKLGLEDVRGTMFYHYATFLRKLQPKAFLFENVKGLRNHDQGRTYQTILSCFEEVGYKTSCQVLNAWDYGCPQKRERLITIGIRKDLAKKVSFSFPEPHAKKPTLRDIQLDSNPSKDECFFYSDVAAKVYALVPPGGWWKHIDPKIAQEFLKGSWGLMGNGGCTGFLRRLSLDEPCLTVMTHPLGKMTSRCHPIEVRPFTYRENARIQTFPDDWQFCGKLVEKYKQIGNAIPVNLAKELGVALMKCLAAIDD